MTNTCLAATFIYDWGYYIVCFCVTNIYLKKIKEWYCSSHFLNQGLLLNKSMGAVPCDLNFWEITVEVISA